jgi:hypothetical protein
MNNGNTPLRIGWSELNNVQEAGQYPFRDGVITVLDPEISTWREHPKALFALMERILFAKGVEYVLGTSEFRVKTSRTMGRVAYRNKELK